MTEQEETTRDETTRDETTRDETTRDETTRDETPVLSASRTRLIPAGAAAVTLAAGLGARAALDGDVAKYAGDALYTVLVFWLVLLVSPRTRPVRAAVLAFGVSATIELFQLTGVPADLAQQSALARLVFGTTFNAPDLFWYLVGAVVVGVLWWGVRRRLDVSVPPVTGRDLGASHV
ncbi:DUF2809 domain-containing protein [Antribacter sp. KLBMP9083]|uniref:DUF2809 domain-containing protein n=1 Tax=Antribacter soli TaxID=2910976 RepID=A0AA41U513_9MICO|nr:DUF2809 domain-containing protein [Antribacter soli]MCF4119548.1 DUF2809 domain-containing protein [Antribacter soli]